MPEPAPILTVQIQPNDTKLGLITAAVNREHPAQTIRSQPQAGNRHALG